MKKNNYSFIHESNQREREERNYEFYKINYSKNEK